MPSLKKKQQAAKSKKSRSREDWVLLGIVVVSALMILCAFGIAAVGKPTNKVERELNKIADDYYITYLYPRLLGNLEANPEAILDKYLDNGVATTYLRQLLHYDNDRNAASATVFATMACDTNTTWVRYYPEAPFGPRDYHVEYKMNCEE